MKQVIQKCLRLMLLAFCALMALPSWAKSTYVFCDNSSINWGQLGAYYWEGDGALSDWGNSKTMNSTGVSSIYYWDIEGCTKVIFRDKNGSGNDNQTCNIPKSNNPAIVPFRIYKVGTDYYDYKRNYSESDADVYLGSNKMSGGSGTYTLSNVGLSGSVQIDVKKGSTTLISFGTSKTISGDQTESVTLGGGEMTVTAGKYDVTFDAYNLTLTFAEAAPSAPMISYTQSENKVTITGDDDCTFYYTTNGDTPTTSSNAYDGNKITVNPGDNYTLKVIAVKGSKTSEMSTQAVRYYNTFKQGTTYYVDVTKNSNFQTSSVTIWDSNKNVTATDVSGNKTIFSFVTTTDTNSIYVKSALDNGKEFKVYADAEDSANLITLNSWTSSSNYSYTWGTYKESLKAPTISKEDKSNHVTITSSAGATIYYTTDGSDPTTSSTPYQEGGFYISKGVTSVKAIAVLDDETSDVTTLDVTYIPEFDTSKTYYIDASAVLWFNNNDDKSLAYVKGPMEGDATVVEWVAHKTYLYKFVPTEEHATTAKIYRHLGSYTSSTYATMYAPEDESLNLIVLSGKNEVDGGTWSTRKAAAPTFEKTKNVVTMTSTTDGATIYYTTDGEDPTVSDEVAHGTSPVTYTLKDTDTNITIKAIAVAENYANSEIAVSESYSYTEPARNTFYVYNNGSWSNIRFWAWGGGNLFKGEYKDRPDIRNYDNENTSLKENRYCQVYSGYIGTKHVYKVVVDEDITNIQFGQYDDNTNDTKISGLSSWKDQIFSTSTKTMNSDLDVELWSIEPMEQVDTPVIGFSNNTVTITGVEGATIYYTTDGSKPTTDSTVYTGPFAVNADESYTVNAIAVMTGYARSVVATKTVTYVKPNLTVYVQNDGGWDKVHFWAWTQDNKDILNSTYLNDATNIQNFTATCKEGHSCVVSKGEYDGSVVYKVVLCSDTYGIKFDGKDDIKGTDNWDGKLYKTSSENTCVDFDASKWEAGEVETLDGYYIIGDLNKWLNGGTYKNNGNEYSYGYDPEKYGTAKDYEFTKVTDTTDLPQKCKDIKTGTWYEYKISDKSVMSGKLSGQFCVYKGEFSKLQKSVETANGSYNVTYYQPKWNSGRKQYAWTESQQTDYIADVTKGLELETMMDLTTGDNKNICLAHNYFYDAKLYFNPDANKIYLVSGATSSDGSAYKDITIYYARLSYTTATADEKEKIKNGTKPSIKINTASMNTTNYVLDTASSQGDMVFKDEEKKMNGVTYPFYWSKRIMPGMELPAGQLLTATIDAEDYDNSSFAIQGTSIYLTDYIDVFFDTSNMAVDQYDTSGNNLGAYKVTDIASVECRIYGYSDDGSTILVCGQDGNFVQADPTDDQCWGMLNQGRKTDKFDYSVLQVLGWEDYDANSENTYPIWSTFSNDDTKCIHISAVNATKFVQFRVKYKVGSEKRSSKRVAATASDEYQTLIMPDYFETSRPDEDAIEQDKDTSEYTWVLTGGSKYITTDGLTTAIEEILDEEEQAETVEEVEAETIYYNLQGQRVKNPERGIYIRVRGSKATKVAL